MEESSFSMIIDLILLKLWYAAVQIREKDEQDGLKGFFSPIIKALTHDDEAEKKQVEGILYKGVMQANDEDKLKKLLLDTFGSRMKDILVGAEKKEVENHEIKSRSVKNLEDALYKADDLMDEVYNEAAKPVLNSKQLVSLGNKLHEKIKIIISAAGDAAARDNARTEEPNNVLTKQWDPVVDRLNLYSWLYNHKKAIEQLVEPSSKNGDEEQHVAVAAIVGYGGIGKTTLALNLFQEQMTNFELPIWVNVPYDVNMRSLVGGIIASKANDSLHERIRTDPGNYKTATHQKIVQSETSDEIISFIEKMIQTTFMTERMREIKEHLRNLNEDELNKELGKAIDGKRLLLVLDGVRDMDSKMWRAFKDLLANVVGDGSRIIITTRSKLVGKITASTDKDIHMLRHLDERSSCKLFEEVVFASRTQVNIEIVEIAVEIVKRCGGDPFAIQTVGEKLKSIEPETQTWSNFRNKEFGKVVNGEIFPSLKFRYDVLPRELKHCFAYCSIFPQQSEIDVKTLIHLWMAQGLIYPRRGQRMEDVGYEYVKHLCHSSLFEEVEVDYESGFVKKFKMPNLIHDLAVLVAGTWSASLKEKDKPEVDTIDERTQKEKNYNGTDERTQADKRAIGNDEATQKDKSDINDTEERSQKDKCAIGNGETIQKDRRGIRIDERTQHVSFQFHFDRSWKISSHFQEKRSRIRTIIFPSQLQEDTEKGLRSSTCENIISRCPKLRTLVLHSTGIKVVPESIGKLKYLRYLDLSQNKTIKVLPHSVTTIPSLMTLKLSSCYGLKELPKDIGKLVHLKHLEIDWCYGLTHMPPGLGQLTQLETLSEFVLQRSIGDGNQTPTLPKCLYTKAIDLASLEGLAELNNLRGKLKIKNLRNVDAKYYEVANLEQKEHLGSLTLSWERDLDADAAKEAAKKAQDTLQGLKPNSKLKELALFGYRGYNLSDWLLSLTYLVKFSLQKCECESLQPVTQLTSLKVLILENMPNLKYISNKSDDHNSESNPSSSTEFIQKIEEIRLTELPELKGWWEERNTSSVSKSFPHLSKLMIEDCPNLHSMPLYPNLKEWLVLKNTSLKTLANTMTDESSSKQTTTGTLPLSNLQSLFIIGNNDLGKNKSTDKVDEICWENLKSLRFLRFDNLPNLKKIPSGFQHVTTLQELEIRHCTIMKNLPLFIENFKQLKRFELSACPKLESLSDKMRKLSALETLEVVDCPILLQRCQKNTGADWLKIRHIENILLQRQPQDHKEMPEDNALKTKRLHEYYWDPKHGKQSTIIKRTVLN